jgi:hypothetical protein
MRSRGKNEEYEAEREAYKTKKEALKEEKRKLEYMLYDPLKVSNGNKDKLKRIREVCDE